MKFVVAATGASGAIYTERLLHRHPPGRMQRPDGPGSALTGGTPT